MEPPTVAAAVVVVIVDVAIAFVASPLGLHTYSFPLQEWNVGCD